MGEYGSRDVTPLTGPPAKMAEHLAALAAAGAAHLQLVLDPITRESVEALAPVLVALDAA